MVLFSIIMTIEITVWPPFRESHESAALGKPSRPEQQRELRGIGQSPRFAVPLLIEHQLFPKKEIFSKQGRLGLKTHHPGIR
jgi:hypothetical protein